MISFRLQGPGSRVLGFGEEIHIHCIHSIHDFINLDYVLPAIILD